MKKLNLLSASLLALVLTFNANAQTSDSDNISATATVVGAISVTPVDALDFGSILSSETPAIAATDANSGSATITAEDGQVVNVTVTFPTTLTGSSGSLTLGTFDVNVDNDGAVRAGSADLTGEAITGTNSEIYDGTYTASGTTATIFVGAAITTNSGVAGVDYSGNVSVAVDYN
ncbi:MAG: hypothetical protein JJ895_01075 [Balneolaceae bacterium]|nr:hypothetical protein [Balneolaceae bacterium]